MGCGLDGESIDSPIQADTVISSMLGKLDVSIGPVANETSSNTLRKRPMSSKEIPLAASPAVTKRLLKARETNDLRLRRADSAPLLPPRGRLNTNATYDQKRLTASVHSYTDLSTSARMCSDNSQAAVPPTYRPRSNVSAHSSSKGSSFVPIVVPRHKSKVDAGFSLTEATSTNLTIVDTENLLEGHLVVDPGKEMYQRVFAPICSIPEKKFVTTSGDGDTNHFGPLSTESVESNKDWYDVSGLENTKSAARRNPEFMNVHRAAVFAGTGRLCASSVRSQYTTTSKGLRVSVNDEDVIADLMENHQEFVLGMTPRLTKLQVVYRCWEKNDIKSSVNAMRRMMDHDVTADIISVLMENTPKYSTLDICTSVLPLVRNLLESSYDRHLNVALGVTLQHVKSFGATICSTLSAAPPVGVDLESDQRLERCNLCLEELKKVNASLVSLTRREGKVGQLAQELSLFLQDIFRLPSSV